MAKKKATKKKAKSSAKSSGGSKKKASGKGSEAEFDIIQLILQDHKPIKELIEIMKDDECEFAEKQEAFEKFMPMLTAHAEPEAEALYEVMKDEDELREMAFEGEVEHDLAKQMMADLQDASGDEDIWMAKCKVLAEMVEHHIEEEETEFLKEIKKEIDAERRYTIGQEFLNLKSQFQAEGMEVEDKKSRKQSEVRAH